MYKLLLVDDEPDILSGMAKGIPWEDWGFTVTGQASDGQEAVAMIAKEPPHVVLSDIRMPNMDGVALMGYLNQNYPEIKVIILSGYNDFEYLQVAIKNQVAEYLLKPTDLDEFEAAFKKLRGQLDQQRIEAEEFKDLQQQAEEGKDFQYTRIFNDLVRGYSFDGSYALLSAALGIPFHSFVVTVLTIHQAFDEGQESRARIVEQGRIVTYCNMRETNLKTYFFIDFSGQVSGVIEFPKENLEWKSMVLKYLQELQSEVWDLYGVELSAGVSGFCRQVSQLYSGYEQAVTCARQKIFLGTLSIVLYPDLEGAKNLMYDMQGFALENLKQAIMEHRQTHIQSEVESVLFQFKDKMIKDFGYVDRISLELMYQLSRWALSAYQIRLEELMEKENRDYLHLHALNSLEEKAGFLIRTIMLLSDAIRQCQEKGKNSNSLAMAVKEYVDQECCSNAISLDLVAEKVKKNSAYISKLFKRETGYNFSDYITRRRMEKSRELLSDPALKIYHIAELTGYADVSNFIKVFKKHWGMSPNEYRSIHGGLRND